MGLSRRAWEPGGSCGDGVAVDPGEGVWSEEAGAELVSRWKKNGVSEVWPADSGSSALLVVF
jgi:hypothetical protein